MNELEYKRGKWTFVSKKLCMFVIVLAGFVKKTKKNKKNKNKNKKKTKLNF